MAEDKAGAEVKVVEVDAMDSSPLRKSLRRPKMQRKFRNIKVKNEWELKFSGKFLERALNQSLKFEMKKKLFGKTKVLNKD
ncbi:hypothetical protein ACH5RR_033670 [Cinchona calisaya]|uniref:Uncharacterized protein n=1 Tax=Cinchona calisaya TaxID=153742 RepID=A0ABD2YCF0_9GENT